VRYGGFWIRTVAYALDVFFIVLLSLPTLLLGEGYDVLAQVVIAFLYETLLTSGEKQATWGKQLLGLKVSNIDGSRITYGKSVGRYFGKWVSTITFFMGFVMIAFTDRKQGLHDRVVNSLVLISEGGGQGSRATLPASGLPPQRGGAGMSGSGESWVIAGFDESGHVQRFRFQILDERLSSSSGLRIGRSEKDNEIVIPDGSISRSHARFILIGRELYLEDLGSKNGTFIGNTRVKPSDKQRVWGDQELRFGDVVFSVGRE
jgi:uncharacterized RDD family membrane protein YckC